LATHFKYHIEFQNQDLDYNNLADLATIVRQSWGTWN